MEEMFLGFYCRLAEQISGKHYNNLCVVHFVYPSSTSELQLYARYSN